MGDDDANEPLEMDYGSDDDVSVEEDAGALGDAAELSKRTNALMNNFRDYVSNMAQGDGQDAFGLAVCDRATGASPVPGDHVNKVHHGTGVCLVRSGESLFAAAFDGCLCTDTIGQFSLGNRG